MKALLRTTTAAGALTALLVCSPAITSPAQFTPVFFDGFDVSAPGFDPNFENTTRQGGVLSPITYQINPEAAHQFWQVQLNNNPLQLAGAPNPFALPVGKLVSAMASPQYSFTGLSGSDIVGKRISFWMDANAAEAFGGINPYGNGAGIVIAGSTNCIEFEGVLAGENYTNFVYASSSFGIRFREDGLFGGGNFIQLFDGTNIVGNLIPNPAGTNGFNVDILVDDPVDGNPWDGSGNTRIDLYVNQAWVAGYTKADGGYTNNVVTFIGEFGLKGTNAPADFITVVSFFDNFLVYAAPASARFHMLSGPEAAGGGDYKFDLLGFPSYNYALDVATNLTPPVTWVPVVTNLTDAAGLVSFTNTPSGGAGFYRTRGVGF